jgi:hypothetical protein
MAQAISMNEWMTLTKTYLTVYPHEWIVRAGQSHGVVMAASTQRRAGYQESKKTRLLVRSEEDGREPEDCSGYCGNLRWGSGHCRGK